MDEQLVAIFCDVDDFCKEFARKLKKQLYGLACLRYIRYSASSMRGISEARFRIDRHDKDRFCFSSYTQLGPQPLATKTFPNYRLRNFLIWYLTMRILFLLLLFWCGCTSITLKKTTTDKSETLVWLKLSSWQAKIDLTSLSIYGEKTGIQPVLLADSADIHLLKPSNIKISVNSVSCSYADLDIDVLLFSKKDRLHIRITSKKPHKFSWPKMDTDERIMALIAPIGEGLYVPNTDLFWQERLKGVALSTEGGDIGEGGGLIAPFWGYDLEDATISFIAHSDLDNHLKFDVEAGRLVQTLSHDFKERGGLLPYEISVALTEKSALAPAFNFRRYLVENGQHKTLKDKIGENPEIAKLSGALHAYVWGDGRTIEALNAISKLGIERMWIGYEDKPHNPPTGKWVRKQYYVDSTFVEKAKSLGFLVGPYDSFHTMQSPEKADGANDYFGDRYPNACVLSKDGKQDVGFAGRGCHASSEAFALEHPKNKTVYDRVNTFTQTGINSYFLDCDATGELFDDYSLAHPMNKAKDRFNRIERMAYIATIKKLVLGSETAAAWAIPGLAFAHGNFAAYNPAHWELMRNKKHYGTWWPPERPRIFFQVTSPSDEYIKAKYNPAYRLPLFQAVYHDAIVTTDRWEISHMKFPNLVATRELFELLYGVPSIWALDRKTITEHSTRLKKLSEFFNILHKSIFLEPLISFKWLTKDKLVQQINFGDKVQVTANFSTIEQQGYPPKALQVDWFKERKAGIFVP